MVQHGPDNNQRRGVEPDPVVEPSQQDEAILPARTELRVADNNFDYQRSELTNGLNVHTASLIGREYFSAHIFFPFGHADDPLGRSGMCHLVEHQKLLLSTELGDTTLRQATNEIGGKMNAWSGVQRNFYSIVAPSTKSREALALLAQSAFQSVFRQNLLERERDIINVEMFPRSTTIEVMERAVGISLPHLRFGECEQLSTVTLEEVEEYNARCYVPQGAELVIQGGLDEELHEYAKDLFSRYARGARESIHAPQLETYAGSPIELRSLPVSKGHIYIGLPTPRGIQATPAGKVAQRLLYGVDGLLMNSLREDMGAVYHVHSYFDNLRDASFLTVQMDCRSSGDDSIAR